VFGFDPGTGYTGLLAGNGRFGRLHRRRGRRIDHANGLRGASTRQRMFIARANRPGGFAGG